MDIIKPPKLNIGDTIGIVATSFPFPTDLTSQYYREYLKAVQTLHDLGFNTKESNNLKKIKWWFAGTPQERADDINAMYADPEVKAIIVHDGGESAAAVLDYLDYDLIRNNPKPFIGFSDISSIHFAMFAQTGLIGLQGPLLTYSLGKIWNEYLPEKVTDGLDLFKEVLTSTAPIGKIKPLTKWENWRSGLATGMLFGGNLSRIASFVGTKYFPTLNDIRGSILFWEIDNTSAYRIETCLLQLKYAGILDVISGMLIGKLPDIKKTGWDGIEEPSLHELIMYVLKDTTFPILAEVDFGHKTVAIPMPIGINAQINCEKLELKFLESIVL